MEHQNKNDGSWVDDCLASLDPGKWQPDSGEALARLRRKDEAIVTPRRRWWLWATVSATAAAAVLAFLLLSTRPACANPLGCKTPASSTPSAPPVTASANAAPSAPAAVVTPPAAPTQPRKNNYKESGSLKAPIVCELYTDYECPHCALFVQETLPQLVAVYVLAGKVRLIHRDFPLPTHPYARTAALYADAAGELGYYDKASAQIFRTQGIWHGDGDIEQQLAPVLSPAVMAKVRDLVNHDPAIAESVSADVATGLAEQINETPSLVVEYKGNKQILPGNGSFALLKSYLDQLLAR